MAFTTLYVTNRTAPYTPATIRGTWDDTAGSVTRALDPTKVAGGANTSVARAETSATNPFAVLLYRGISGPLAAQTITGTIDVILGILESAAGADLNWKLHVYVTQGNSDTPRGTLLANYAETAGVNEWPTTATGRPLNTAQALSSLAISDGDRLVVEIGFAARNGVTTSFTGTLRYGTVDAVGRELANLTNGSVSVTTLAGLITFSNSIAEYAAGLPSRVTLGGAEVLATLGVAPVRVTLAGVEILSQDAVPVRVTQAGVEVLSWVVPPEPEPPGGGEVDPGSDPSPGLNLCGGRIFKRWIEITPAGSSTTYRYSDDAINVGSPKEPRVKSYSSVRRALTSRSFDLRGPTMAPELFDTDRVLRGLEDSDSLVNAVLEAYVSTEPAILAGLTPRRVFSGVVRDTEPIGDLLFRLQVAGYLQSLIDSEKKYPQLLFNTDDFPNLGNDPSDPVSPGNPGLIGKPVPCAYGLLSDESAGAAAMGVAPLFYVGRRLEPLAPGGFLDEYVVCRRAIKGILAVFVPSSELSTGTSFQSRIKTTGELAEIFWAGTAPWATYFGSATTRSFNGNEYTLVYGFGPRSGIARSGLIPMTANLAGYEDAGDSSGALITSLPRQRLHALINFILGDSRSGGPWLAPPSVNGYSRVQTATFEAVHDRAAVRIAGGHVGAWLLGWDGAGVTFADFAAQCAREGMDLGENADGQIIASMIDPAAASVRAVRDVNGAIAQSFRARRQRGEIANWIYAHYARRMIQVVATVDIQGVALTGPVETTPWIGEWVHTNGPSEAKHGYRPLDLPLEGVRELATAADIASLQIALRKDGPIVPAYREGICGTNTELGNNTTLDHFEGVTADGYADRPLRCEAHTLDLDALTVETEHLDLQNL